MKWILFLLLAFSVSKFGFGQNRTYTTIRSTQNIEIDGNIDNHEWGTVHLDSSFIVAEPTPGIASSKASWVQITYDDNALYVAAQLFDDVKNMTNLLCQRDGIWDYTDNFYILLDTYHDGQNAFSFGVSSSGVQEDSRYSSFGEDATWDAVWQSAVKIYNDKWTVEMKIPYSAIRFSNEKEQVWGLNFGRQIREQREFSTWQFINNNIDGYVRQFGLLKGINNIASPKRIAILPYLSVYKPISSLANTNNKLQVKAGADLKLGISDGFTLDMTLIPDFGQVISDALIYNLGPYEVRYQENRPFFTEGAELFSKHSRAFYTRRIGQPSNYFQQKYGDKNVMIENIPQQIPILNAFKITGRTKNGTGIGMYNAITQSVKTECVGCDSILSKIEYEPLSVYNASVVDLPLKNNGFFSIMNSHVWRNHRGTDANTLSTLARFPLGKQYVIGGSLEMSSNIKKNEQDLDLENGNALGIEGGKTSGNFVWNVSHSYTNATYNPNEMGYLDYNNRAETWAFVGYRTFKPNKWFINQFNNLNIAYTTLFKPRVFTDFIIKANRYQTFKNFLGVNTSVEWHPLGRDDYNEPRIGNGYFYHVVPTINLSMFFSSDYRKKLAYDIGPQWINWYKEHHRTKQNIVFSLRWRPNKHWLIIPRIDVSKYTNQRAYVLTLKQNAVFGERELKQVVLGCETNYTINNKMFVNINARHYWLNAVYDQTFELNTKGNLDKINIDENIDVNVNYLNLDMVYTMQFAPGSFVSLSWKNNIALINNNDKKYIENLKSTLRAEQLNTLSLRLIYYLDYQQAKQWIKK